MSRAKDNTVKQGFAARWSRRKQQVKLEQEPPDTAIDEPSDQIATTEELDAEQLGAEKQAELNALKDEDMPDIATLQEDSDFSQFMSTGVSEELRKLALRKLFHGKTYNVRDGLDEYDGDYTSFEKLDPGTITADMKYRQELEAEKLKAQRELEEQKKREADMDNDSDLQDSSEELEEALDEQPQMENKTEAEADNKPDSVKKPRKDKRLSDPPAEQNQAAIEAIEKKSKEEKL
jgi:hypothetical protein